MREIEDILYRVGKIIVSSREAFDTHIAERYSSALPLAIYISISFALGSLVTKGIVKAIGIIPLYNLGWILELIANLSGVIGVAISLINLLVYASLVHISTRIMGYGEGRWDDLIGLIAYSSLPLVFPIALAAVSYLASWFPLLIASLILIIPFGLWSLYLIIVATSVNYEISLGHALIASVVIPMIVGLIAEILTARLGAIGLIITILGLAALYIWKR